MLCSLKGFLAGGPNTTPVLNNDGSPAGGVTTRCELVGISAPTAYDFNASVPTFPVLSAGPEGSYDGAGMASAAVAYLEDSAGVGTYYMFYSGIASFRLNGNQNFVEAYDTTLNVATSPDGVNWTKSPDNPIAEMSNDAGRSRILGIAAQTVGPRIHLWVNDAYGGPNQRAVGYFLYEPNPIEDPAPAE